MTVCEMRTAVKSRYNNRTWCTRVNSMSNKQVMAIYYRMFRDREIHHIQNTSVQIEMQF